MSKPEPDNNEKNDLARPGDFDRSGTESLPITGALRFDKPLPPPEKIAIETSVESSIDSGLAAIDEYIPRMGDDRLHLPNAVTGEQTLVRVTGTGDTVSFSDESTVVTELPAETIDPADAVDIDIDPFEDDADETLRTRHQLHLLDIELVPVDDVDDDQPVERKTVEAEPISMFDYTSHKVPTLKKLPEFNEWKAEQEASTKQATTIGTFWSKLQTAGNITTAIGTLLVVVASLVLSMSMLYSNTVRTLKEVHHQPVSTMQQIVNHNNEIKTMQMQNATTIAEQVIDTGVSAGVEFSNIVASTPSVPSINNKTTLDDPEFTIADLSPEHDLAPQVDPPSPQPTTHVQPPTAIAESGPANAVNTTGPKTVHSNAKTTSQKHQASAHKIVVASHIPRSTPKTSRPIKAKSPESLAAVQPPTAIAEPGPAHVQGEIQPAIFEEMPVIVTSANAPIYRNAHMFIHSDHRHSQEIAFLQGF